MSKRRTHSLEFKSRDAMEVISCRKTIQKFASDEHGLIRLLGGPGQPRSDTFPESHRFGPDKPWPR